jgi:hypothetical protein
MEDTKRTTDDERNTGPAIGRRAFFGRALLVAGAGATLLGLSGCPGGGGDDDDGDDGGGDDDD